MRTYKPGDYLICDCGCNRPIEIIRAVSSERTECAMIDSGGNRSSVVIWHNAHLDRLPYDEITMRKKILSFYEE